MSRITRSVLTGLAGAALVAAASSGLAQSGNEWLHYGNDQANTRYSPLRQINAGTGGESALEPTMTIHPASEVRSGAFGVLKVTLRPGSYDWEFVPIGGSSFRDSGTASCH